MQFAAVLLAVVLALPTALAAGSGGEMVRVGLAYGSGALVNANLENNTGYGTGYRMGYFDETWTLWSWPGRTRTRPRSPWSRPRTPG